MESAEILSILRQLGIAAQANGDKLVMTPGSKVPPELVPEIQEHKAEIMALVSHDRKTVGYGQAPPLDRPPETEMELRRLIDHLADPVGFAEWFEQLMEQTDSAEEDHEEVEEWPVP
jgi:hypothetical protein